ncbi:MAG: NADPH:quinone oxidoreductase family protein [Microscillaceae bacterium]|nr:NADPH:quinone oxidoreductase family protein [Microscillaceae bacterium]
MKALICKQWGKPEDLMFDELPEPQPGPYEVKIRVEAVGLNLPDLLMIMGRYQAKPPFPFVPCGEVAGEVAACGAEVREFAEGDRVLALCGTGGLAEYAQTEAKYVWHLPNGMKAETGAALGVAYSTAYLGLVSRAQMRPGEKLLVHGAAGGMGLAAVNLGAFLGAEVIATASNTDKLALAKQQGAKHLIAYLETDMIETVRQLTQQKGVDVVYDPVGGDLFDQSLHCVGWEGRLLSVGFASGRIPQVSINRLLMNGLSISGLFLGGYKHHQPARLQKALSELIRWHNQGGIRPHIARIFPFEEARQALTYFARRETLGKVVVCLS